jgi:hypothetical protein
MPTNRHPVRHPRRGQLSHEQELELWLGPSHRGSAFGSESERVAAWRRHRDRLMTVWAKHGTRPDGWWRYESPIPRPRGDTERSTLYVAGLLSEEERAELETWWRGRGNRISSSVMALVASSKVAAARRAHLRWADVPSSLVDRWQAGRRRRGKTIRSLEAAAGQPTPA